MTISKKDIDLLKGLCYLSETKILKLFSDFLTQHQYSPIVTKDYLIAEGDLPILLVAHVDTVFPKVPTEIYFDSEKNVMWSPNGLGADDRAGVFGIAKILQHESNLRPHILLTTGEESGGIGVSELITTFTESPFLELKYVIELDRQGFDECVFYDCDNQKFINYVTSFDFVETIGLFSDISILCPAWNIAGVNLSIGYIDEHSYVERLFVNKIYETIEKVITMLKDYDNIDCYKYFSNSSRLADMDCCDVCHKKIIDSVLTVAQSLDSANTMFYALVCPSCAQRCVQYCKKCKTAFIDSYKNDLCYSCRKETN